MTSDSYYEVRSQDAHGCPTTLLNGRWHFLAFTALPTRITSRKRAEELAAEHGGKVVRVTVTEVESRLRWEKSYDEGWSLLDTEDGRFAGFIVNMDSPGCCTEEGVNLVRLIRPTEPPFEARAWSPGQVTTYHDTLDAARAAVESAVKEGWT